VRPRHEPVLLEETLRFLRQGPGLYLDATLGEGGHAEALLSAEPGARLLGTDRDPHALESAGERLRPFGGRVTLAHASFREIPEIHRRLGGEPLVGALYDLGLSSRQIDEASRGMSFQQHGPLDLRMDRTRGVPAAERLAQVDEEELAEVLREHGDVPFARRLARTLVVAAREGRLETTGDLVAIARRVLGRHAPPRRLAQVFQALRIWINDEALDLEATLDWLPSAVRPGGVVVTIAYHSGDDRRIKRAVRGPIAVHSPLPGAERPPEGPWEAWTHKVVKPTATECARNPRARSARLRAFRRRSG